MRSNSGFLAVAGEREGRFSPELGARLIKYRVRGRWSDAERLLRRVVWELLSNDFAADCSVRLREKQAVRTEKGMEGR